LREAAIGKAKAVAVTVDAGDTLLDEVVETMQPDMLQLHGSETPERVAELKARYGLPVMKALAVSAAADLGQIKLFVGIADRFLFDAKPPKGSELPGGNGVAFDWRILAGLDAGVDYMLSGGLNAANIGDALRLANPPGLDISSGVESAPGVKDPALIEQFFRAVGATRNTRAA
jgi:phosphoribosylanthranilate isomerase